MPLALIVPVAAVPPVTPSTAQVTLPPLPPATAKGCARMGVSTVTRGVIERLLPVTVPVPVNATVWGVPEALSATATEAFRTPAAVDVKVTAMAHVVLGASGAAHVFVCAKSAGLVPAIDTPLMTREAVPLLVTVTFWTPLVIPVGKLPKSMLDRLRVTSGTGPLTVTRKAART